MYISKEELNKRLKKTDIQVVERKRKTRNGVNINNIPEKRLDDTDRNLISILDGQDTQKNIAEFIGVSPNTVSLNSRGIISPSVGVDKELTEVNREESEKKNEIRQEATKRIEEQLVANLAAALGHVANNLSATDAGEASRIADNMSRILDRVTISKNDRGGNRTAIIINVPSMKEEKNYQTITV